MYLPRFSWRVGLQRRRSVRNPLIFVSLLPLTVLPHFAFYDFFLSILAFSHFPSHNSAPLTFFSHFILCPVRSLPAAEKARVHIIFPLLSPPQPQPHFWHFSPQRSHPQPVSESLLQFSLDNSLTQHSSPPNCICPVTSPSFRGPLATSEIWFFWENYVDIKVSLSETVIYGPFSCRLPNAELNVIVLGVPPLSSSVTVTLSSDKTDCKIKVFKW